MPKIDIADKPTLDQVSGTANQILTKTDAAVSTRASQESVTALQGTAAQILSALGAVEGGPP